MVSIKKKIIMTEDIRVLKGVFNVKGRQLFLVGGAVRDLVLGNEPHDYDFATDATPAEMLGWNCVLSEDKALYKVIDTGSAFGTVTFIMIGVSGSIFEITTFRTDHNCDGRHTDVKFAKTIEEDLSRRDFTINAMAIDMNYPDVIIDPFNGQSDLKNKIIKTVGNATERFEEDTLRVIRGFRFAARYDFEIDFYTIDAMMQAILLADNISKERIKDEIIKAASSKNFSNFIRIAESIDWLNFMFGYNINHLKQMPLNKYHTDNALIHTLKVVDKVEDNGGGALEKIAALLHDIGKIDTVAAGEDWMFHFRKHELVGAQIAKTILEGLRFSNNDVDYITFLVENHMYVKSWKDEVIVKDSSIRKLIRRMKHLDDLLRLVDADNKSHHPDWIMENQVSNIYKRIEQLKDEGTDKINIPVDGNDIMEVLDIKPGKVVGEILRRIENYMLEFPDTTRKNVMVGLLNTKAECNWNFDEMERKLREVKDNV